MESDAARAIRRALSANRTDTINNAQTYPATRKVVIETLQNLATRLEELDQSVKDKFGIDPTKRLVYFYMKGGNAFKCIVNPQGADATQNGGGSSDWDTQAVVDPWAPYPVQAKLYAEIEDIVHDELVRAGVAIAAAVMPPLPQPQPPLPVQFPTSPDTVTVQDANKNNVTYTIKCDDPQTLRTVFDRDKLGLWMNGSKKLNDKSVDAQYIPGIILNDAIPPFQIFRMGYTWHAEPNQNPDIDKPILMELIDITLPRRNTVEAVSVWNEIERGILRIEPTEVSVDAGLGKVTATLPLPELSYHLREISTMLAEIADGSSHHADKLPKRLERFKAIYDNPNFARQTFLDEVSALAGVAGISPDAIPNLNYQGIDQVIRERANAFDNSQDPAIKIARNLMALVASRVRTNYDPQGLLTKDVRAEFGVGRANMTAILKFTELLKSGSPVTGYAFSDDLVLIETLADTSYAAPGSTTLSGMRQNAVLRVSASSTPDVLAAVFANKLMRLAAQVRANQVIVPDPSLKAFLLSDLTTNSRSHNSVLPSGPTNENTVVAFSNSRPAMCLTFTSATDAEAPFRQDPQLRVNYSAPADLAAQRKVSAALIEDYTVRTAISQQYERLKNYIPGV